MCSLEVIRDITIKKVVRKPYVIFTQGLVYEKGVVWESGGLYGKSSLVKWIISSDEYNLVKLPLHLFGEGISKYRGKIVQLTWKAGIAILWDSKSLVPLGEFRYKGEGWGLTTVNDKFYMSDGSSVIKIRDPKTFGLLGELQVFMHGEPLKNLNELEYAEGLIWANVWQKDYFVGIDPATGVVIKKVICEKIVSKERGKGVLNGIAYMENGDFLITGKMWDKMYVIDFQNDKR